MNNQKPYDLINKFSSLWEKPVNDFIHLWTNNHEFIKLSKISTDTHLRSKEIFNKSQELFANQLNFPTKEDVANVAKISIQSEEKLDSFEEQIWSLQDSVSATNKELEGIVEVSNDIIKLTKQLKTELTRSKVELNETKKLHSELLELKNEVAGINDIKKEISILVDMIGSRNTDAPNKKVRELAAGKSN